MGDRPFRGTVALAAGRVTQRQLQRDYTRVFRDVYVRRGAKMTARVRALAAACFCGNDHVVVGVAAAAMSRTKWIDDDIAVEVVRRFHHRPPRGMVVRHFVLGADEITVVDGVNVTTPARTAFDIARRQPRRDAVTVIDALCRATNLDPADIARLAGNHAGERGVARVRRLLADVDPKAESPPESHLRLLLIDAGLRPESQVHVFDRDGVRVARCDLGWAKWNVVVEYDGEDHWGHERRAHDIERIERLEQLGWTVVRVTAKLLYQCPNVLVERIRQKLRQAGAPG